MNEFSERLEPIDEPFYVAQIEAEVISFGEVAQKDYLPANRIKESYAGISTLKVVTMKDENKEPHEIPLVDEETMVIFHEELNDPNALKITWARGLPAIIHKTAYENISQNKSSTSAPSDLSMLEQFPHSVPFFLFEKYAYGNPNSLPEGRGRGSQEFMQMYVDDVVRKFAELSDR